MQGRGSLGNADSRETGVALIADPAGSTSAGGTRAARAWSGQRASTTLRFSQTCCEVPDGASSDGSQSGRTRSLIKAVPLFFLFCNGGRNSALRSVCCGWGQVQPRGREEPPARPRQGEQPCLPCFLRARGLECASLLTGHCLGLLVKA